MNGSALMNRPIAGSYTRPFMWTSPTLSSISWLVNPRRVWGELLLLGGGRQPVPVIVAPRAERREARAHQHAAAGGEHGVGAAQVIGRHVVRRGAARAPHVLHEARGGGDQVPVVGLCGVGALLHESADVDRGLGAAGVARHLPPARAVGRVVKLSNCAVKPLPLIVAG